MHKLYDLNCYWNDDFSNTFSENNKWYAEIIVNEDTSFEGILYDEDSAYEAFIFGHFKPNEEIQLTAIFSSEISAPLYLQLQYNKEGYIGNNSFLTSYFQAEDFGKAFLVSSDAGIERADTLEEEIGILQKEIQDFKEIIMDEAGEILYIEHLSKSADSRKHL